MEAPSWKQQLALGSYLAVIGGSVVLLLVPAYVENPGFASMVPFNLALATVVGLLFLPFVWWRTTAGYIFAVFYGVVLLIARTGGPLSLVADGTLLGESLIIIIPNIILPLLLIAGSVLAWREG